LVCLFLFKAKALESQVVSKALSPECGAEVSRIVIRNAVARTFDIEVRYGEFLNDEVSHCCLDFYEFIVRSVVYEFEARLGLKIFNDLKKERVL